MKSDEFQCHCPDWGENFTELILSHLIVLEYPIVSVVSSEFLYVPYYFEKVRESEENPLAALESVN